MKTQDFDKKYAVIKIQGFKIYKLKYQNQCNKTAGAQKMTILPKILTLDDTNQKHLTVPSHKTNQIPHYPKLPKLTYNILV